MTNIPMAFQGELGAYSQEALEMFGRRFEMEFKAVPTTTLDTLFQTIANETELGIVPIENSTAGLVNGTIKLLLDLDFEIIGEFYLPVNHALLGNKGNVNINLEGRLVHSHEQALAQCSEFIMEHGLGPKKSDDTAGSAYWISQLEGVERFKHFAIASPLVAKRYGLDVIRNSYESHIGIQDRKLNYTRFLIVRPKDVPSSIEASLPGNVDHKATIAYKISLDIRWSLEKLFYDNKLTMHTPFYIPTEGKKGSNQVFNRVFVSDIGVPVNRIADFYDVMGNLPGGVTYAKVLGLYPKHRLQIPTK